MKNMQRLYRVCRRNIRCHLSIFNYKDILLITDKSIVDVIKPLKWQFCLLTDME